MEDLIFIKYASLFARIGKSIYLVGGGSRDTLLGREFNDYDFATDATPEQMKDILPNADYSFAKYGFVKTKEEGKEIGITTFRKEGEYDDYRHPSKITFVTSMEVDSKRRDFTVNAIYLDVKGNIYDFHGGLEDLKNKILRFIGDPYKRIKEDPLRILRAQRFAESLQFIIEESAQKAINELSPLLEKLNKEKIKMEERKRK